MNGKVVGYSHLKAKNGSTYTNVSVNVPYTDDECKNGSVGSKSVNAFVFKDVNLLVGDNVTLMYEPDFKGVARVVDIIKIKEEK